MPSLNNAAAAVKSSTRIDEALARHAVESGRASWRPEPRPYSYTLVEPARYEPARYEPSADDMEDYNAWAKDFNNRQFARQIEADEPEPTAISFACWIAVQAHVYREQGTEEAVWLADRLAELASRARYLDASSPEQFNDRNDAAMDAARS